MTERQLRTECEVLSKLGLITKKATGMSTYGKRRRAPTGDKRISYNDALQGRSL